MSIYRHCTRYHRSGPKKGRCAKYAPGRGRARHVPKHRGVNKGKVCIRYHRSGPNKNRCAKFGTKSEARKRGLY